VRDPSDRRSLTEHDPRTGETPAGYRVWPATPGSFSTHARSALRHSFDQHPLMQLPALAKLAEQLMPTQQCRFVKPGGTQSSRFDHDPTTHDGRQIDEVFRRIEEPGSWIALYNVETNPTYRGFLEEVMACARPLVEPEQPGIFNVGGFIFVSAPPSVTPFHIDRENNFWLQVKGRKTMTVFDHTDRELVAGVDVDRFIVHGDLERVRLADGMASRGRAYDVGPGDGVYFPSTSPHMTRTVPPGDGVSISIGVVFYTEATRAAAYVHASNLWLRKVGLDPSLPGRSALADGVKSRLGRVLVAVDKLRGYQPRASF
jgi:hypothetical protein